MQYWGSWWVCGAGESAGQGRQVPCWVLVSSMLQTGCAAQADGATFLGLLISKIGLELLNFSSLVEVGGGVYGDLR